MKRLIPALAAAIILSGCALKKKEGFQIVDHSNDPDLVCERVPVPGKVYPGKICMTAAQGNGITGPARLRHQMFNAAPCGHLPPARAPDRRLQPTRQRHRLQSVAFSTEVHDCNRNVRFCRFRMKKHARGGDVSGSLC